MTPKTKIQKEIVALSNELPQLTSAHNEWAMKACVDKYFIESRSTSFCLECGHTWKVVSIYDWRNKKTKNRTCPSCSSSLKPYRHSIKNINDINYFSVLTAHKGYQAIRIFQINKEMKKGETPKHSIQEVMQHWIATEGKIVSMAKPVFGRSMYYDQWLFYKDMSVQDNYFQQSLRFKINPACVYPKKKILPTLKRNGFSGRTFGLLPQELFSALLGSSFAETLIKEKQYAILQDLIQYSSTKEKVEKYWNSLKICFRNKYLIEKSHDYFDYLNLLERFGKDLLNKKYVCPDDFHSAHNALVKKRREEIKKEEYQEQLLEIEMADKEYQKEKKKFFGLAFSSKNIKIQVLKSVNEFVEIGDKLHHCLFTNKYYEKQESLIFKAMYKDEVVESLELDLENMKIIQSRGLQNEPTKHSRSIRKLINQNISTIESRFKIAG